MYHGVRRGKHFTLTYNEMQIRWKPATRYEFHIVCKFSEKKNVELTLETKFCSYETV